MPNLWDRDVELSAADAARLINAQFPALAPAWLETYGTGWDNEAFLVNGRFVFRFPRRRVAVRWMRNEIRVLPLIADRLPLPVPRLEFVGTPGSGYPYPYSGYAAIAGETACRMSMNETERARGAASLGMFLAALHAIPVDDATRAWAPVDEIRRADLAYRATAMRARLSAAAPKCAWLDVETALRLVERLAETPPLDRPTCWVHGDLYPRHLLVDANRDLCGVIDWGDVHLGDPALDLSIAFSFLPPGARGAFRQAYGPIDPATWDRARFRAIHYGPLLLAYGEDIGDEDIRAAGEHALKYAIA